MLCPAVNVCVSAPLCVWNSSQRLPKLEVAQRCPGEEVGPSNAPQHPVITSLRETANNRIIHRTLGVSVMPGGTNEQRVVTARANQNFDC